MSILAKRIRYLRERNNYSQKRVAESLGLTNVQLSRYESGDRKPEPEVISALADFYDVTTDYLHGRTENMNTNELRDINTVYVSGKEVKLTPEEMVLFEKLQKNPILFHKLIEAPEKKLKIALRMIEAMEEEDDEDDDIIED